MFPDHINRENQPVHPCRKVDTLFYGAGAKCIGGNKYGAFLLSNWLNSFESVEKIFEIDNKSPSIYRLNTNQKKEFHEILKELEED